MSELVTEFEEFTDDLLREAEVSGEPQQACFFQMYADAASENGDCSDLIYTPVRRDGTRGYQIDGYAIDPDQGELHVTICDFRDEEQLESLIHSQIETLFRRAERFVTTALAGDLLPQLEETSPEFEAYYPIYKYRKSIRRIRLIIFSNARFASRKKSVDAKEVDGRTIIYNLLDFTRYTDITKARGGTEPIEIDIAELGGEALPCLLAHTEGSNYQSFLVVIPGELLAQIYGRYGPRLLEQNVRTFLQARTKVNRGIIDTVGNAPEMFFAYNNGITATASGVTLEELPDGGSAIRTLQNLQIVNGAQTTASVLYAKDRNGADLSRVYIQMKLSVVDEELIDEVVPKISRYANTQNRISEADFFAGHPFHLEMEKISRRLSAPQKAGSMSTSKWFYERARGQYKDQVAYGSPAVRRRFEAEFPKGQVVVKTDLAKYELTFARRPDTVSRGAQKCFLDFADTVDKAWDAKQGDFNEAYFKERMAKAIVFRWTDSMVARSDWYKEDRGYKAQTVTYCLALLAEKISQNRKHIDFQKIWNLQDVPEGMKAAIELLAPMVAQKIRQTPDGVKNVGEYCKQQACWAAVSTITTELPSKIKDSLIASDERRLQKKDALDVQAIDREVDFETRLLSLVPHVATITAYAEKELLMSPKTASALKKLQAGRVNLVKSEKNLLRQLFKRMMEYGFEFPA
jgi:hypothetical protein